MRRFHLLFTRLICLAFPLAGLAQNPDGPQRPDMPDKEPEITISNNAGMQMQPNPNNADQQIIIYTGQVELIHRPQQMIIQCERLEFYTKPAKEEQANEAENDQAAQAENQADQGMQAEKIIAIGSVVILKTDAQGNVKIARSGRAEYDPDTGTAVLTVAPQIQDDKTLLRAKDKRGVITIRESGVHEAQDGNFETIIKKAN